MKRFQGMALAKASALALICAAGAPQVAFAQDAAPDSNSGGATSDDIVVTARLREENVQTVPIAITALSADDLTKRNINSLNDLTNSTPGVAITTISGGTLTNIYIRGQAPANTAGDLNVEANVGVFIDDIYQTSRNTIDIISVLDVGQIQIAKGPQSALFGRSTFAGAMSISTRRPSTRLEGNVQATVGIQDDYRLRGSISVPISDTLSARIGAGYLHYGGFGENAADPGDKLGGTEKYAVTASLEYRPTEELTARLSAFLSHSKTEMSAYSGLPLGAFNCGSVNAATGLRTLYCGELPASKVSSITADQPDTVAQARQVALNLNWRRSGVSVTSITGFTEAENESYNDYDMTGAGTLMGVCTRGAACLPAGPYSRLVRVNTFSSGRERVRTFSQEVRLQSDNSGPFQWIFGGSYFNSRIPLAGIGISVDGSGLAPNERLVQVNQITTPPSMGVGAYDFTANPFLTAGLGDPVWNSYTDASTKTMSIFGSLEYRFGDLRVSAEGRYNIDRKRAQVFSVSNPLSQPGITQPIIGTNVPEPGTFPVAGPLFARTFESFAPRFTIDYQATPDIFFYATAAKGVRSGGFNTANPVGPTGILADEVSYEEETNWTYEAGIKSELFDRALLLNASFFHVDWTNAQVSAFTLNPTTVNPVRIVRNAGNIKTDGFEVQSEFRFADMFRVGGSLVYSDPKFQAGAYDASIITQCVIGTGAAATAAPGCPPVILIDTPSGPRAVTSLEGKRPQRAVKLSWNINASMEVPLTGDWRLFSRVDVSHTGDAPMNLPNTALFGERTLTSARIAVENDRFSVAVWANNIFGVTYVANAIAQPRMGVPFAFSVPEIYLGEGRRVGLTVGAKF
ncbi:iron complex outermembrane receptor protein [Sphingomonas zeicaulis]|uniref:TonB-dependent receptor n=1 Tax=Sphingomonas zeicaulis TaxID=1632740 RepID=UPI003D21F27B